MSSRMNFTDRAVVATFVALAIVNLPATYALQAKGLGTILVACIQAAIWAVAGQVMESRWFEVLIAGCS